jgi:ABC-2 type transport system permease protein
MTPLAYLRIWLASARYSAVRAMMYRFDFFLWLAVDTLWMIVNLVFIQVVFDHTEGIADWTKPQMILLVGTSMLIMRLFFATAFTNLVAVDRNLREGTFDFYLAQPGNPLFMIATRKIEFDSLTNSFLAAGVVIYGARECGLHPGAWDVLLYVYLIACGLLIHFSIMTILVSFAFWLVRVQGIEGGYFGLFEVSKLPGKALQGIMEVAFVWVLPAIVVTNVPARTLLEADTTHLDLIAWLTGAAVFWFALATTIFHRGLRRYQSASS